MDKKTALINSNFGSRVAEDEVDELGSYFVETEQWRKVIAGDVDVIYGAKGAGKSALYALLVGQEPILRLDRRTVMVAAENPRGTPAFRDLANDPPTSEEQFRGLWKLYFLALLANYLRHHLESSKTSNSNATSVINTLVENGLLEPNVTLISRVSAILEYLRHRLPSFEIGVKDPNTNVVYTGKITLGEPSTEQKKNGYISADALIEKLNKALQQTKITVWLVLDRLDVAFSDSTQLEVNALRSLFRVYLDVISHSNISIKIFLRDDIWRKLTSSGFREASHITRSLNISWDRRSLINLIVRRVLHNPDICQFYSVNKDDVLDDSQLQKDFFYKAFPPQVDIGQKQPNTLDWMLSRVSDSSKRTTPRELIHLLNVSRDKQLEFYELGNEEPPGENLFDRAAIREALPEVSKARYEQTLCAEYPSLKSYLDKLERAKTQHNIASLAGLWNCSTEKASTVAEQLVEAGFFERKGSKENPAYWIPFVYRDALNLVQGSAT